MHIKTMMLRLYLFDIDGTIIYRNRKTQNPSPFRKMLKEFLRIENPVFDFKYAGRTDLWIIKTIYKKQFNRDISHHLLKEALEFYKSTFYIYAKKGDYLLHKGAKELVEAIYNSPNTLLAIISGNIAFTGKRKLELVGLKDFFAFGVYGDTDDTRTNMVKKAIEIATKKYASPQKIYVIGDTPLDIISAKENNAISVAVATGPNYSYEELIKYEPDFIYHNFSEYKKIAKELLE